MKRKCETRGGPRLGSGPKPFIAPDESDEVVRRGFRISLSLWTAAVDKAKSCGTNISTVLRDYLKVYVNKK